MGGALLLVIVLVDSNAGPGGGEAGTPSRHAPTLSGAVGLHHFHPKPFAWPTPIRHVFVVMLENAKRSTVVASGPFEDYLAGHYASASHYYAACHPSAPNYLAITSGGTWQCGSDAYKTYATENLGDLAQKAGLSWDGFEESMPSPCSTSDSYPYAVRHNPLVFFSDVVANSSECRAHDVPFSNWTADLGAGTIPNFAIFSPNLTDDGHDTNVAYADKWLHGWLTPLVNDSFFASSVFFVLYDESVSDNTGYNGTSGGNVYFSAVSPYARAGFNLSANMSHYDLLTTVEWLLGLGTTGNNDTGAKWPPMQSLFSFSNRSSPLALTARATPAVGNAPLTTNLSANATGGTPPYGFSWQFPNGTTRSGANVSTTFSNPGDYAVTATVSDSLGEERNQSVQIQVGGPLTLSSFSATPSSVTPGQNVTFVTAAGGGLSPLTYRYADLPPGCGSANVARFVCAPSWGGTYPVNVTVHDAAGAGRSAVTMLSVAGGISVTVAPTTVTADVGHPFQLAGALAGGNGTPTLRWSNAPPGCALSLSIELNCTPTIPGTYNVSLWANDSRGHTGRSAPAIVEIFPLPTVSIRQSGTEGSLPLKVQFAANVSGGVPPLGYLWTVQSTVVGRSAVTNWTFASYGRYRVVLTVTDGLGGVASTSSTVTVLTPIAGAIVLSPSSTAVGLAATVGVNISGGAGGYHLAWLLNGSAFAVGNRTQFEFVPDSSGSYQFIVRVTDAANDSAQFSGTLEARSGPGPGTWAPPVVIWVLGIALLGGAATWAALAARRRRPGPPVPPE